MIVMGSKVVMMLSFVCSEDLEATRQTRGALNKGKKPERCEGD
jgi:hypothetical protein